MSRFDQLRDDHHGLRAELDALAAAVAQWPATRFVVEQFCVTLAALLAAHVEHEHRLALEEPARRAPLLSSLLHEHDDTLGYLRAIIRLWSAASRESIEELRSLVEQWAVCLRQQFSEQEAGLRSWEQPEEALDDAWMLSVDSETMMAAERRQALPIRV